MENNISTYEEHQVNQFLHELYKLYGKGMEEDEFAADGWEVYLIGKKKWKFDIADSRYWDYVQQNMEDHIEELRKIRNQRIQLESRLSMNHVVGENKEEIGTLLHGKAGDFANSVILWNYASWLGKEKYSVLNLMNAREEDKDIMQILGLDKESYDRIIDELRVDFQCFLVD